MFITQELKNSANEAGMQIGCAASAYAFGDYNYSNFMHKQFDILVAEYGCKSDKICANQGNLDYSLCDQALLFTEAGGQLFKYHTLMWPMNFPTWMRNMNESEMYNYTKNYLNKTIHRYKGKVHSWDVVNEAFDPDGVLWQLDNWPNSSFLYDLAFNMTREIDATAKLLINDFNTRSVNDKSDGLYNYVVGMIDRKIPIDGVGFQSHLRLDVAEDWDSIYENIQRFIDLGLEVHISELDVSTKEDPCNETCLELQAQYYYNISNICLKNRGGCKSITFWGAFDNMSWKLLENHPNLWDENTNPKPAYFSLLDLFRDYKIIYDPTPSEGNGKVFVGVLLFSLIFMYLFFLSL